MSQLPARRGSRVALLTTLAGLGAIAALPATASADANGPNSCDASALRLSLLGGAALDPIHANPAATPCVNADGTLLNIPSLLGLVGFKAVEATTRNLPNNVAASNARVAGLHVGVDGLVNELTGPLLGTSGILSGQLTGALNPVLQPLGLQLLLPDLLNTITGTLPGVLTNVLPSVLDAGVIEANAQARCVNGAPQLSGNSQIADLKVLGTTVDVNDAANRLLSIDTTNIRLGQLLSIDDLLRGVKISDTGLLGTVVNLLAGSDINTLYDLKLANQANASVIGLVNTLLLPLSPVLNPLGLGSVGAIVTTVTNTLQPLLNSVQLSIPPGLLNAKVTPNSQVISGGNLSQSALSLSVSVLSRPILDGTIAQAQVGAGAPGCVPPATPPNNPPKDNKGGGTGGVSPGAAALLQCTKAPLTLIDVGRAGSQTFIYGVARSEFIGKEATIYLSDGKKKVGSAKVDSNGFFSTKVALPPARIRQTNKARYYAQIDGKNSRALKFSRRMTVSRLTTADGEVTMRGTTTAPRRKNQSAIVIKQRLGCNSYKTLTTVTPDGKGRFSATFKMPAAGDAAVYRAQTQVPRTVRSKKQIGTFTLPRVAGL